MKTKQLLLSFMTVALVGGLIFSLINDDSNNRVDLKKYKEREVDVFNHENLEARGAAEWLNERRVNPETGIISNQDIILAKKSLEQAKLNRNFEDDNLNWQFMGPDDVGGRTRGFIVDNDGTTLWTGGVAGGIWKSTTSGLSWLPIAVEDFENLSVSAICQDIEGNIFVGTGEYFAGLAAASNTSTGFRGSGIWKSTDGGQTFSHLTSTSNINTFKYITELIYDAGSDAIYATTNNKLVKSIDKGETWITIYTSTTGPIADVKIAAGNTIIFSIDEYPSNVYSIIEGEAAKNYGSMFDAGLNRIELAVSKSDPNYVYAFCSYYSSKYFNLYQSTDTGNTWTSVVHSQTPSIDPFGSNKQGYYDNTIAVYPNDPTKVILGGIDLWQWSESNAFERISFWAAGETNPKFVHADQHNIIFHEDFENNNTIYFANDGGIFVTKDDCGSFSSLNKNYGITQYYGIDCGPKGEVIGGAQDNGTNYIDLLQPTELASSIEVTGGDGGHVAISKLYPGAIFSTIYYSGFYRSNENGNNVQMNPFDNEGNFNTLGQLAPYPENGHEFNPFVTPIDLWESFDYDSSKIYIPYVVDTVIQINEIGNRDTLTTFDVGYTFIIQSSVVSPRKFEYTVTPEDIVRNQGNLLAVGDTLAVREKFASLMAIGGAGNRTLTGAANLFITRNILDFKTEFPQWDPLVCQITDHEINENLGLNKIYCVKWSTDGNSLYVLGNGTGGNNLYRFTGIKDAYHYSGLVYEEVGGEMVWVNKDVNTIDTIVGKKIKAFGSSNVPTSIAVDPNNVNRLAVTIGGYGSHAHIWYSEDILASSPDFVSIDGTGLPVAPIYSSVFSDSIPAGQNDLLIIGTEYGVYSTTNIDENTTSWVRQTSIPRVPVFDFAQQTHPNNYIPGVGPTGIENSGCIYAGSFGLGIWKMESFKRVIGINEIQSGKVDALNVKVYPNPAKEFTNVNYSISKSSNVEISVYSITGKLVYKKNYSNQARGSYDQRINVQDYSKGLYIVSVNLQGNKKVSKFIVE